MNPLEVDTLRKISQSLSTAHNHASLRKAIATEILSLFGCTDFRLWVINEAENYYERWTASPPNTWLSEISPSGNSAVSRVTYHDSWLANVVTKLVTAGHPLSFESEQLLPPPPQPEESISGEQSRDWLLSCKMPIEHWGYSFSTVQKKTASLK